MWQADVPLRLRLLPLRLRLLPLLRWWRLLRERARPRQDGLRVAHAPPGAAPAAVTKSNYS